MYEGVSKSKGDICHNLCCSTDRGKYFIQFIKRVQIRSQLQIFKLIRRCVCRYEEKSHGRCALADCTVSPNSSEQPLSCIFMNEGVTRYQLRSRLGERSTVRNTSAGSEVQHRLMSCTYVCCSRQSNGSWALLTHAACLEFNSIRECHHTVLW